MNGTGGEQHHLTDADGGHGYALAWSPDSRKIAFVQRTNVGNRQADLYMQSLQSAIAVVDITTGTSWVVASPSQTGMQLNLNPSWTADSTSITFTASNPTNTVLGGTPRYWSAHVTNSHMRPAVTPLTPMMPHIVAGT
jgi:Tol biopolymer transport system component